MTHPQMPYGQPPRGFSYNQLSPDWVDPGGSTQPATIPPHRPQARFVIIAVAALVAAFAALAIVGLGYVHSAKTTDLGQLRAEVAALHQQYTQDQTTIKSLTATVHTLSSQQGTLAGQIKGMAPTVHFMGQFPRTCTAPEQGSNGPYTATFACKG